MTLTGGGSRSAFWCGMIADVLQREVHVPAGTEFGARGAAMLAAVAVGAWPDAEAASLALRDLGAQSYHPGDPAPWEEARARCWEYRDRLLE